VARGPGGGRGGCRAGRRHPRRTLHFELVSNESGSGVTRVGLDYNIPIANAILTTENDEQAVARIEEKAADAAKVAVECANLVNRLIEEQFDDEEE